MKYLSWTGLQHFYAKYIEPIKEVARTGKYEDLIEKPEIVNNTTTTEVGTVLDGRVGKTLKNEMDENREYFEEDKKKQDENISNIWKNLDQLNERNVDSTVEWTTVRQKIVNMNGTDFFAVATIDELMSGKVPVNELDRLYIQAQNADENSNQALVIATTMRSNGQVIVKLDRAASGTIRLSFFCAMTYATETKEKLEMLRYAKEAAMKPLINEFDEDGNMIIPDAIDANTLDPNEPAVEII